MKLSKKVLSLLAVLALMGTMLSVMTFASAEATNLVVNGDFEDGINGWSTHFGQGNTLASTTFHSGAGGTAHKGWNGDPFFQTVTVTPGKTYEVSYWIKGGGAGSDAAVVEGTYGHSAALYYVLSGDNATVEKIDITVLGHKKATGAYGDWTQESFKVTPATGTITLGFANNNGNWLWIDDVSIVETGPTNLVVNGGFETGDLTGWSQEWTSASMYNAAWPSNAHSGNYAVLGKGNPWGDRIMYQNITVEPGKTYVFSLWFKYTADNNPSLFFGVVEGTTDGKTFYGHGGYNVGYKSGTLLGSQKVAVSNNIHSSYTEVTFEFTPTQPTVMIGWCQNGGNGDAFYVDDVSVVEKNSDLVAEGAQIRPANTALRFGFSAEIAGVTVEDYNRVMDSATMYIGGKERTVTDFGAMLCVKVAATEADLSVDTTSKSSAKIPAQKLYEVNNGVVTFVATLYNIPNTMYDRGVSARAYVEYEDENGDKQYVYGDTIVRSVNDVQNAQ